MSNPLDAPEVLDREYLDIRARLLEAAASLDRIDRAEGSVAGDPRMDQIGRALAILAEHQASRAEQLQLTFSLPYDENWRLNLGLKQ